MTTIDAGLVPVQDPAAGPREEIAVRATYLNAARTVRSWALTTDVLYADAPFGVAYLVAVFTPAPG